MVVHLKSKDRLKKFFGNKGGHFKIESYEIKCRELSSPKTKTVISREPGHPSKQFKLEIGKDEVSYTRVDPSDK